MKEIYFATLYNKTMPAKNHFDFIPLYGLIGTYDPEQEIFISQEGKKYPLIHQKEFLNSSKRSAVENLVSLIEWEKNFEEKKSIEELLKAYHKTFHEVYFFILADEQQFLKIRYHEYMMLVGYHHLLGIEEIRQKIKFKRNLNHALNKLNQNE